ncbi:hypothetical protein MJI46_34715, partial [Salmonella enterica subsp. enterica serovar Cerro]|nr:hypothetical protein [Salmonella enterica subsp. enterica serovar Cerro]
GSTLGGAEYVAEHLAEKLEAAGFSTETVHGPLLEDLSTSGIWQQAARLVRGVQYAMTATGAREGVIALKEKYRRAIDALTPLL